MKIKIGNREVEITEEQAKELKSYLGISEKRLSDVEVGETFNIGDMEFVKFKESDGSAFCVMKNRAFNCAFNKNSDNNFANSEIKSRLEKEILPKLEKIVGKENIIEFETDLFTIDGLDIYGKISSRISLPTFDFYRENRSIFEKYPVKEWAWLSTANGNFDFLVCVSPLGCIFNNGSDCGYGVVRPILLFKSSIFVS